MTGTNKWLARRIAAQLIDIYVVGGAATLIYLFTASGHPPDHLSYYIWIGFLVYALKDSIHGVSLGRFLCGLNVRRGDKKAPVPLCFIRNLFMLLWPLELLFVLVTGQRLCDKLTGCHVAKSEKRIGTAKILATVALAFVTFVALLFYFTYNLFVSSPPYQTSLTYIKSDAQVQQVTGGVTGFGWFGTGVIQTSLGAGNDTWVVDRVKY